MGSLHKFRHNNATFVFEILNLMSNITLKFDVCLSKWLLVYAQKDSYIREKRFLCVITEVVLGACCEITVAETIFGPWAAGTWTKQRLMCCFVFAANLLEWGTWSDHENLIFHNIPYVYIISYRLDYSFKRRFMSSRKEKWPQIPKLQDAHHHAMKSCY